MNDLVAQLREAASESETPFMSLEAKAADAIEALQAEVENVRRANLDCMDHFNAAMQDLAARDLVIKQMQSAIEGMFGPTSQLSDDRFDKLSAVNGLQPSTEALDAYVVKEIDERVNSLPLDPAIKNRITTMIRHTQEGK